MSQLSDKITALKTQKDAVILAHYYVNDEVQELADYIGDSYYLSELATKVPESTIVFCGVSFMGESAKILNSGKKVLMPDVQADCPMAHMADAQQICNLREQYDDLAVVCYVNSTAELKSLSDVCVTSSNALKIVKALPNKNIFFIPDENLGRYIAALLPEKNFIFNDGYCHVHTSISAENVRKAKASRPDAKVLVHPECQPEVTGLADYIGSTAGIINYASKSEAKEFIICTEMGILHELQKRSSEKKFYSVGHRQFCPNMKRITPEKIIHVLETGENEVQIDQGLSQKANQPLKRMLELAR